MKVWTSSFERGSSPVVGSSRSSSVGLVSRARAIATFCCIPRLICSTGRSSRFSEMPSRARITIASRLAVLPSRPYSRAAKRRFSIGLSFLKKAASTLTRLISRLTAISSRTMSWPKTSTRPSSRVRSPQIRRMSVDLPEPLAPRTPWMSPRSRRIDTCEIAVTGFFFRPTTNRLLTSSMRRAGGPAGRTGDRTRPRTAGPAASSARSSVVDRGWRSRETPGSGSVEVGRKRRKPRVRSDDASSGGPRGSGARAAWTSREGIKKAGGPIWPTALVRPEGGPAACGLARDGHRSPVRRCADGRNASMEEERIRHHSSRLLLRGSMPATCEPVGSLPGARKSDVNPDGRRCACRDG